MQQSWRRKGVAAALVMATAAFGTVISGPGAQAGPKADPPGLARGRDKRAVEDVPVSETGSYIVILAEEALVDEFDQDQLRSPEADAQATEIRVSHDRLLDRQGIGAARKLQSYTAAINGFAVQMSKQQADKMAATENVSYIIPDELQQPTTDASPEFLGLSGEGGVWAQWGKGDNVVIGVIDTGIWPEHPSLDPKGYGEPALKIGPTESSTGCDFGGENTGSGLEDASFDCNGKLIGARYVMPTYLELTGLSDVEYASARDEGGHGTHTATTAAGNEGVEASVLGISATVSGIAPLAQIVAYKALGELGGYSSDLAGAIDQAVADGVDVINYSIGSSSFAIGADDISFLFAADAGVHVATSNGNSGPGPETIGSPASVPWLTSVGASTHDRTFEGAVTISEGVITPPKSQRKDIPRSTYTGASITKGTGSLPLLDAEKLGNELCDPSIGFRGRRVTGKIVLCKRGAVARIDKSLAVAQAGGAGMILYNTFDAQEEVTDTHWVPSVHINNTDGLAIKQLIKDARQPMAQIDAGKAVDIDGSTMAAFSSRGPNLLSNDIIKPDVTAPGVNILAGNTPTPTSGPPGWLFQSISGTSMSSPHVAGLMALIDQSHPDWSPAAVKSALMTTARQDVTKEDGRTPADPFDMGAGHVNPPNMLDPGLVYDAGIFDYAAFSCGAELGIYGLGTCAFVASRGYSLDPSQFNQASIAIGDLAGSETVTRYVTNVTDTAISVTPQFDELIGVTAIASPFTVPAGKTVAFDVTFTVTSAPVDSYTFGSMTLVGSSGVGDQYSVYSPIALRPVTIAVPDEVSATIESGGTSFDVTFGYNGAYAAAAHGLVPAVAYTGTVQQDADQIFDPSDAGAGAVAHTVEVSGAAVLRVSIPPIDGLPDTDLDLYVFDPSGNLVATSTNGGTDELVDIQFPADGTWTFYVHGWGVGAAGTVDYTAQTWVVSLATDGNMGIESAPTTARIGATGTVTVVWPPELNSGDYLGAVAHRDGQDLIGLTLVDVTG